MCGKGDATLEIRWDTSYATMGAVLRLDDYYVWDSWVADDGDLYHLWESTPSKSWTQYR